MSNYSSGYATINPTLARTKLVVVRRRQQASSELIQHAGGMLQSFLQVVRVYCSLHGESKSLHIRLHLSLSSIQTSIIDGHARTPHHPYQQPPLFLRSLAALTLRAIHTFTTTAREQHLHHPMQTSGRRTILPVSSKS